ncbi:MAG: glycosyltransferase family 2 protein [Chitinophagaceae bacterium]|nr:MAG: glycosyltransferase family 2 protein [Chitinophagaceae bacterium]
MISFKKIPIFGTLARLINFCYFSAMHLVQVVFFIALIILFYSYVGYFLIISIIVWIRRERIVPEIQKPEDLPGICLIIAAYNEGAILEAKILNSLNLEYAVGKKNIIIITDGSTDNSAEILARYPEITVLHEPARKGKVAAMHRAVSCARQQILVFSDANTILNSTALLEISKHYQDPLTGGVAGEKKVIIPGNSDAASSEGLYWKYESLLKQRDSDLYSVVGAAGELFSIRSSLYEHPGDKVILDDFIISMRICQKGFRVAYERNALATETPSISVAEEQKRKIRISAGAFQSIIILKGLLNIFRYPVISFQYISHRVLRWAICPFLFPMALALNITLALQSIHWIYIFLLAAQLLFYISSLIGWYLSLQKIKVSAFYAAYYLVFINICLLKGLAKYLRKEQTVLWDKAERSQVKYL